MGRRLLTFGCSPWFDKIFCAIGFGSGAAAVPLDAVGAASAAVLRLSPGVVTALAPACVTCVSPCAVVSCRALCVDTTGFDVLRGGDVDDGPCTGAVAFGEPCVTLVVCDSTCVACGVTVGCEPVAVGI